MLFAFRFVFLFKVYEILPGFPRIMFSNEAEHVFHVLENDMISANIALQLSLL